MQATKIKKKGREKKNNTNQVYQSQNEDENSEVSER